MLAAGLSPLWAQPGQAGGQGVPKSVSGSFSAASGMDGLGFGLTGTG
jgi:hypothetical protein